MVKVQGAGKIGGAMGLAGHSTRAKLLRAAEKSVALFGPVGQPNSQIVKAAGQGNASAIHYHFGSREGLIRELIRFRISKVEADRMAMLRDCQAVTADLDMETLISVLVLPLARCITEFRPESFYIRFLQQIHNSVNYREIIGEEGDSISNSYAVITGFILLKLKDIPEQVRRMRLEYMNLYMLSALVRLETTYKSRRPIEESAEISDIISQLVAMLMGQVSEATVERIASGVAGVPGEGF